LRKIDTTNKFVNRITRTLGNDSIIYFVGGNRFAIKDSVGTNPAPVGYYGAFQDNTTQTAVSINTAYAVKLNTTDLTNGVSIVNNISANPTIVKIANAGIYNIQFSLQLEKTGGSGNMIADIWLRKNGVNLEGTTGKVVLTGSANASPVIASWNYVLAISSGDSLELMWATSNDNVVIKSAVATAPHPSIPSAILTVTQQSGIMAGTGISPLDTANMLSNYARTNLVNTKLNISDTASMLTNYQRSLTFSTGLTNTSRTITSNLSTGVSGGQSIIGGTDASSSLTLSSTSNATKGKLLFGTSAYDEVNNRLGLGISTPATTLDVSGKANIEYSATTDFPLVIKNTNASATTSNVLSFDCSATGADQPVFINLASANAKGISFFASNQAITATPVASGFQMYSNSSTNFPGQMYFDGGANNNSSIIFRTAQTSGTITQRMRIFANGNVSISSSATNSNQAFSVNGVSQATQFKLSALNTAPASATATGTLGEIRIVNGFIYVCVATNTWQRTALSTW